MLVSVEHILKYFWLVPVGSGCHVVGFCKKLLLLLLLLLLLFTAIEFSLRDSSHYTSDK